MSKQIQIRVWEAKNLPPNWFKRESADKKDDLQVESSVKEVIKQVREKGNTAIIELTEKFDKAKLTSETLKVTPKEIKEAYESVTKEQVKALKFMKAKVKAFEQAQISKRKTETIIDGITIQTFLEPLESVGCYVPGGQAVYPSTLIMTVVPAKVAGVPRIVACSPPNADGKVNPLILVAADICQVDEVFKVGGAQAIAALAYGTETIKPVRKIVGPGSKYVTMAKILVSRDAAIDMPAGPSEVLILADDSADPRLIAFDMISQAEHGGDSVAALITTSQKIANQVQENLAELANLADRGEKVASSLEKYGFIIICDKMDQAVSLTNEFASEHLEVMTEKSKETAKKLTAGLILIGPYSPVALSDYGVGTNHVLPTAGFAHSFSGLSALDFTRRVNIVKSSKVGLKKAKNSIKVLTEAENLPNHYKAIKARFEK